jgi:hypothetical protein
MTVAISAEIMAYSIEDAPLSPKNAPVFFTPSLPSFHFRVGTPLGIVGAPVTEGDRTAHLSKFSNTLLPHGVQMPWVTGSVPSFIILLHQAQIFFMFVFSLTFLAMGVFLIVCD